MKMVGPDWTGVNARVRYGNWDGADLDVTELDRAGLHGTAETGQDRAGHGTQDTRCVTRTMGCGTGPGGTGWNGAGRDMRGRQEPTGWEGAERDWTGQTGWDGPEGTRCGTTAHDV